MLNRLLLPALAGLTFCIGCVFQPAAQDRPLRVGATARTMLQATDDPIMNGLGMFWLWVGSNLDYVD